MKMRIIFNAAVLFLLICLGILFVAAAKTYNAIHIPLGDDDAALICAVADLHA